MRLPVLLAITLLLAPPLSSARETTESYTWGNGVVSHRPSNFGGAEFPLLPQEQTVTVEVTGTTLGADVGEVLYSVIFRNAEGSILGDIHYDCGRTTLPIPVGAVEMSVTPKAQAVSFVTAGPIPAECGSRTPPTEGTIHVEFA